MLGIGTSRLRQRRGILIFHIRLIVPDKQRHLSETSANMRFNHRSCIHDSVQVGRFQSGYFGRTTKIDAIYCITLYYLSCMLGCVVDIRHICSFADVLHSASEFFAASLAFRTLQAVGVTASSVAYYAVAAENFGENMDTFLVR